MCMKYINTTAMCFKSVSMENDKIISYNAPFKSIKSSDNGGISVDAFSIVTQIDFLGTNNETHKYENPLEQKQHIDFIIRLTKCDKDEEKRIGLDLDLFSIDLEDMYEKNQVDMACFGFLNYTRITNVNKLSLPGGIGKYVIKVLVKDSNTNEYAIQSMTSLNIL